MRLRKFSDYALRLLILAASRGEQNITIDEAARIYRISAPHLKKVVRTLTREGILIGTRGRSGGFRLARPPEEIVLGDVLRLTESDFGLVECFLPENRCAITGVCKLPAILDEALRAMLGVLDSYTLADITLDEARLSFLPLGGGPYRPPERQTGREDGGD